MGCDIHFSIEVVSKHYYRKKNIKNLLDNQTDDKKLSFKEYCAEENAVEIVKTWSPFYIDWFEYVDENNLDEDEGDESYPYVSEKTHFYKFKELGYKLNSKSYRIGRNYSLFSLFGNVRGEHEKCISADRGLPEDVTEAVKYYADAIWKGDGHSHTWISLKEITDFGKDFLDKEIGEYYWINIFQPLIDLNYPLPLEDVRFVFWFDN